MRVAVLSDVHANLAALEAVLDEVDAVGVDELWCLGDTVGYGPQPNECCDRVNADADLCLVGNHDLVVLGELTVSDFNDEAAAAALWTADQLTEASREFLAALKPTGGGDGVGLYHGSARDPVWEYVLSEEAAWWTLQATHAPLVLVGHSHVPLAIALDGDSLSGGVAGADTEVDLTSSRWLLNPGSVGQPRDGDARAAYLLVELETRASFRRVDYPIAQTQAEMRARRLPEALAERLAHGL